MEEKKEATKKAKTVKKQAEKPAAEQKPTEKKASPAQLKPEEKVLIMACKHPVVATAAIDAAKARGVEVVLLEDKVIEDYLIRKNAEKNKVTAMEAFLSNQKNRQEAHDNAVKLYAILTGGGDPDMLKVDDIVFTETQVVHATTLSHKKARQLFELLRAFGYIEFVSRLEFKFIFNDTEKIENMLKGVESVSLMLVADIVRARAEINNANINQTVKDSFMERLSQSLKSVK